MSNTPHPVTVPPNGLMATPDVAGFDLLRQVRKTPTVLYGIFTELVQQFYMNADNLAIGVPQKVFSPDKDKTKIWIDTELRWNDEHPEFKPAIYIKLSPITYSSLTGRTDAVAGGQLSTGEEDFSRSGTGTVSFVHLAGSSGEACMLGDATLDYLDAFGKVIRNDFCFTSFSLTGRTPLQELPKESKERYGSVVDCTFVFQDRWTIKLESQRLKLKSIVMRAGHRILERGIIQ